MTMRISTLLPLVVLAAGTSAFGQALNYVPTPNAAFVYNSGANNWQALTSAAAFGALNYVPTAIGLYCQASANAQWTPCTFSGGGGSGTVTSVGSLSPLFTTTNATTTPTFTLNTQAANTVFAGPASGSAAAPTFRALVANDIPNNLNYINVNGNISISNGIYGGSTNNQQCLYCSDYVNASEDSGMNVSSGGSQLFLLMYDTHPSLDTVGIYLGANPSSASAATNATAIFGPSNLSFKNGVSLSWSGSATGAGTSGSTLTQDTGISRSAAGVVSVDTTTASNSLGTLQAATLAAGAATWTSGAAAPTGTCTNGSLYSNTAGSSGSTFYACVATAWVDIK